MNGPNFGWWALTEVVPATVERGRAFVLDGITQPLGGEPPVAAGPGWRYVPYGDVVQ